MEWNMTTNTHNFDKKWQNQNKPLVKICANRSIEDAKMCLDAHADLIGFLVGQNHKSDDFVTKEKAKEIVDFVNHRACCVLVTHLTNANEIIEISKFIGIDFLQLHSNLAENEVEKIANALPNVKLIRLIHIGQNGEIETDYKKIKYADFYLLDSFNKQTDQVGGTGIVHDWNVDKKLVETLNKPTFIAGGLNPNNVEKVIKIANPAGVDVNSGCKENGKKNAKLIENFVKNAKKLRKNLKKTTKFIFDYVILKLKTGEIKPVLCAESVSSVDAHMVTPDEVGKTHIVWSHGKIEKTIILQENMVLLKTLDKNGKPILDENGHENVYDVKIEEFQKIYTTKVDGRYAKDPYADGTVKIAITLPDEIVKDGLTLLPPNWDGNEGTLIKNGVLIFPFDKTKTLNEQISYYESQGFDKVDWYPNNESQTYSACDKNGTFKSEVLRKIFNQTKMYEGE